MTIKNNDNQRWTVKKADGTIYGPSDTEAIKRWIQEKRVLPEDHISPEGLERWQPAKSIAQFVSLFNAEAVAVLSASTKKHLSWKLIIGVAIGFLILIGAYVFYRVYVLYRFYVLRG